MDYKNATVEELETLVNQKDGEAICELGERCLYGRGGITVNPSKAYKMFHKGENMQMPRAYVGLGEMYRKGIFFAQNETMAREYYAKAGVDYPKSESPVYYEQENRHDPVQPTPINEISDREMKRKVDQAEQQRSAMNYSEAKTQCEQVLKTIQDIRAGHLRYVGQSDLEDFEIEADWILAYTAFNQKEYSRLEHYLAQNGVIAFHPWGCYLQAIGHQMMQSSSVVMEQDLQNLLMVRNNQNMTRQDRGDINVMIGDLITDGYGTKQGIRVDQAREYYQEAARCGNEFAKEQLR